MSEDIDYLVLLLISCRPSMINAI